MCIPLLEKEVGLEVYASKTSGIGGKIKRSPEDFIVEEILIDGSEAKIQPFNYQKINGRGRYLICVLIKRNWDTLHAIDIISKQLHIASEHIQFAGIKDAKALTSQHISISSISGINPEQILKVKLKDISILPKCLSNTKISSKHLFGNRFNITIQGPPYSVPTINYRIKKITGELSNFGGIPNFFGHQRFGTIRPITHKVGRLIVQKDWKGAAYTFLFQSSPLLWHYKEE